MKLDLQQTKLGLTLTRTRIYVFTAFSSILLLIGCGVNRHLRDCSVTDLQVEKMLVAQIDSVYRADISQSCKKFKKIVSCEHSIDSLMGGKTKLIIKVENRCKTWEYFYFNEDLKLIEVIHELPQLY